MNSATKNIPNKLTSYNKYNIEELKKIDEILQILIKNEMYQQFKKICFNYNYVPLCKFEMNRNVLHIAIIYIFNFGENDFNHEFIDYIIGSPDFNKLKNEKDSTGSTPIFYAVSQKLTNLTNLLKLKGCNQDTPNVGGAIIGSVTPSELSFERNMLKTEQLGGNPSDNYSELTFGGADILNSISKVAGNVKDFLSELIVRESNNVIEQTTEQLSTLRLGSPYPSDGNSSLQLQLTDILNSTKYGGKHDISYQSYMKNMINKIVKPTEMKGGDQSTTEMIDQIINDNANIKHKGGDYKNQINNVVDNIIKKSSMRGGKPIIKGHRKMIKNNMYGGIKINEFEEDDEDNDEDNDEDEDEDEDEYDIPIVGGKKKSGKKGKSKGLKHNKITSMIERNKLVDDIHNKVVNKIKEMYPGISEDDARILKSVLYQEAKKDTTLGPLERAKVMEKLLSKKLLDKVNIEDERKIREKWRAEREELKKSSERPNKENNEKTNKTPKKESKSKKSKKSSESSDFDINRIGESSDSSSSE